MGLVKNGREASVCVGIYLGEGGGERGNKALKLRYICRLFAKELVLKNFTGYPPDQLLERMIELNLHTEEHLKKRLAARFIYLKK